MNINTRKFVPFCLSGAVECNSDKQGRILIPNSLKVYSEIEKDIVFIGMSHRIEIWSKANWDVYNNEVTDRERLRLRWKN